MDFTEYDKMTIEECLDFYKIGWAFEFDADDKDVNIVKEY